MDVGATFVAHGEAAKQMKPCDGSLHDPAVATEPFARFDSASRDPSRDVREATGDAAEGVIVRLVGMKLVRASARPTTGPLDAGHALEHRDGHLAVVEVGARDVDCERHATGVDDHVVLGACFATIGRVRARFLAPPFALTLDESKRAVHFLGVVALAGFVLGHVVMVACHPRTLLNMPTGGRRA